MKSMHVYYEEKYQELISKYESAMKDKMTLKVERESFVAKIKALREASAKQQEKLKAMMVEQSQKNFDNSGINESFSGIKKVNPRKSKARKANKENQSDSKENESLGKYLGFKKSKKNPLLTPIPKDLPNSFVNANTGMTNEMKPVIGMNLGPVKKIKVGVTRRTNRPFPGSTSTRKSRFWLRPPMT